jgi:hypothetical protein
VLAIAVPVVIGFAVGGPGLGTAVTGLVGVALVYITVKARPRGGIGEGPSAAAKRRVLVVVSRPVEDATTVAAVAAEVEHGEEAEVMVLAPARIRFLDRWASDLEDARRDAQKTLVISVASLAKVGIAAEARVGDEDIVQAVEDQLGGFRATEVVLVTASDEADPGAAGAADELAERLRPGFRRLVVAEVGVGG